MRAEARRLWRHAALALLCLGLAGAEPALGSDAVSAATATPRPPVEGAFWGQHLHRLQGTPVGEAGTTAWPPVQVGALRLWDAGVSWWSINPERGVWDFRRLDVYVNTARARGAQLLYPLALTPRWASARPAEPCPYNPWGCSAEPRDMADFAALVRAVASRYGDRIEAYELWNEPGLSELEIDRRHPLFFTGSVTQLVEMARIARAELDAVQPAAKLCTPGFVNGPQRLDLFLAAGGKQYVQAVCYHFYASSVRQSAAELLKVRAVMLKHGLEHLPLWNTESGAVMQGEGRDPEDGAALMAQLHLFGAAAGWSRFFYYAWDNQDTGMLDADGDWRRAATAYAALQSWVAGVRFQGCRLLVMKRVPLIACRGERDGEARLWLWSDGPATAETSPAELASALGLPGATSLRRAQPLFAPAADRRPAVPDGRLRIGRVPVQFLLAADGPAEPGR